MTDGDVPDLFDIHHAARAMALQDAARVCTGKKFWPEPRELAVILLGMAHDAEPDGRDLGLDWDPVLAAQVKKWSSDA